MASSSCTTPAAYSYAAGLWTASARSATDTVKDDVMLQYGGVCWLCESPCPYPSLIQTQMEVAHNVDASIEATVVSHSLPVFHVCSGLVISKYFMIGPSMAGDGDPSRGLLSSTSEKPDASLLRLPLCV